MSEENIMSYIFLHRKLLTWEWYQDANTFRLFMHLLLNASYEANRWQGIDIQPGQLITGRKKLAEQLKLSEKQIRVALNHLKETGEVAIKTANKFSIITICKWEDYQEQVKTKGPTERPATGPAEGQQRATTKEGEEDKEVKEDIYRAFAHLKMTTVEFNKLVEAGFTKAQIDDTLDSIENYKKNKQYTSLYLTANKWLKKNFPETQKKEDGQVNSQQDIFSELNRQRLAPFQKQN